MLCRTDFLKKTGGFDERYFLYFEDFALSMEMQKHGALHFLPSMKIIHYGGDTAKKGLRHIVMFISSSIKFFNQYGWKLL
jgi:GT2 family glycosyltransferase